MIRAGRLRERIRLQRQIGEHQDAVGGTVLDFDDYASPWAERISGGGREFFKASAMFPEANCVRRIRFHPGVSPLDQGIGGDGKRFEIVSVEDPDGTRAELLLVCKELL